MTVQISAFWSLFRQRAADLGKASSADSAVYDELLECLHLIDPGLYIEFSTNDAAHELIITAEGNRDLFPLARAVVAAAPTFENWTVRALKPKIGFPKTVRWEGLTLTIETIVFDPLERPGTADLGLRILVPSIDSSQTDDAHNAILRAIDHGLGEERHAEAIRHSELQVLPDNTKASNFIPLVDLEKFIDWRNRRHGAS